MYEAPIVRLEDCCELRQALQARPPLFVHGSVMLLGGVLFSAVLWAGLTQADLVVRAPGRVRPVSTPKKVVSGARGGTLGAGVGGRALTVHFREGDVVRKGDVLVRLATDRLDNEIERRRRTIRAAGEELARLAQMEKLLAAQAEAARKKAREELSQAESEERLARQRQESEVRLAELELSKAEDERVRTNRLARGGAATQAEVVRARIQAADARERLQKARLPLDEGKVAVARQAVALVERDAAVKKEDLAIRRGVKRGEADAAALDLASLELERREAELRSPLDGVVTGGEVRVGDLVEGGKVVCEVAEQQGFVFEMAVPSEEVGRLRVGMPARIRLDAYDHLRYGTLNGTVTFIAPDSTVAGGQVAAYLVKIAVDGEEVGRGDLRGAVKLGMAGQAEVVTDRERLLYLLMKKVRQAISLG